MLFFPLLGLLADTCWIQVHQGIHSPPACVLNLDAGLCTNRYYNGWELYSFLYIASRGTSIEPAGHSPFTKVYKVLKYAWSTSVLSIAVPLPILGGGYPLTQVKESMVGHSQLRKWRMLKPFCSLFSSRFIFGFHLVDNGYSSHERELYFKLCPLKIVFSHLSKSQPSQHTVCDGYVYHCFTMFYCYMNRYIPNMLYMQTRN